MQDKIRKGILNIMCVIVLIVSFLFMMDCVQGFVIRDSFNDSFYNTAKWQTIYLGTGANVTETTSLLITAGSTYGDYRSTIIVGSYQNLTKNDNITIDLDLKYLPVEVEYASLILCWNARGTYGDRGIYGGLENETCIRTTRNGGGTNLINLYQCIDSSCTTYTSGTISTPSIPSDVFVHWKVQQYFNVTTGNYSVTLNNNGTISTINLGNNITSTGRIILQTIPAGHGVYINNLVASDSSNFTITAINYLNISPIMNFSASINGTTYNSNIATGQLETNIDKSLNSIFNIDILNSSYYLGTRINNYNTSNDLEVNLVPNNIVNLTIRNESNGGLITQNVSITAISTTGSYYSYTATNGNIYIPNFPVGNWDLRFSLAGYTTRDYQIIVNENTQPQIYNIYLNNGTAVLMNVKTANGFPIPNALITATTFVNGTLQNVESKLTDITGKAQFSLTGNQYYSFNTTATGYIPYYFALNPVLFTSYDIVLSPLTSGAYVPSGTMIISPTSFYNHQTGTFILNAVSTFNSFENYTLRISGKFNYNYTGTNSHGEIKNIPFNISNAISGDNITIFMEYNLNNGAYWNKTTIYPIVAPTYNRTITTMGDNTHGLALGDRIFLVTFINIGIAGILYLIGGTGLAMIGVFINTAIFANSGFVPWYTFYVTLVLGMFLLISKGQD